MGWTHRKQSSARERKPRNLTSKRNGARSGRTGHASRRTFSLTFSLLTLNFPFRRHKAAGDGRQTLTGRKPATVQLLYVRASRLIVLISVVADYDYDYECFGVLLPLYFARQSMATPARMAAMAMALRLRFPSAKSTAPSVKTTTTLERRIRERIEMAVPGWASAWK